ncbi:MAG TPA: hypothetical protein PKD25_14645 [Rubrivivax sp.]|nr:hypothetical protein [Rubrivivax sp.]
MRYEPPPPCTILAEASASAAAAHDIADEQMTLLAYRMADRLVVADIECEAVRIRPDSERLWDVRHMLDPRESCDEAIDMVREAIAYGVWRGLLEVVRWQDQASGTPAVVRITRSPA